MWHELLGTGHGAPCRFAMLFLCLFLSVSSKAQLSMRDVLLSMPDSIFCYVDHEKVLDLVDYWDARMPAQVVNRLDGDTSLDALTADSLAMTISSVQKVQALLLRVENPVDSVGQVVVLFRNYTLSTGQSDQEVACYTADWRPLVAIPPVSASDAERIDRLVNRVDNLLKYDGDMLNKSE